MSEEELSSKEFREVMERLAKLEANAEAHARDAERAAEAARHERHHIEEHFYRVEAELDDIRAELSRYRGTVGGILLAFTAIGTALKLWGGAVLGWFQ